MNAPEKKGAFRSFKVYCLVYESITRNTYLHCAFYLHSETKNYDSKFELFLI